MSPVAILLARVSRRSRVLLAATAAVGVIARLAVWATAVAVEQDRLALTTVVGIATAALWLLQRVLAVAVRSALEIDLHRVTSRALLESDVLGVALDDLHRVVWEGHARARNLVGDVVPALLADAVAAAVLVPIVVRTFPAQLLVAALGALAVVMATTFALRGMNARLQDALLQALQRVNDRLLLAIEARLELVSRGAEDAHARALEGELQGYRDRAHRSAIAGAVLGRAPLAAGIAVAGLVVLADAAERAALGTALLGQALVLAAVVPPVLGLVVHVNQIARDSSTVKPFIALLLQARRPELERHDREAVQMPSEIVAERIGFAYGKDRSDVLREVSFRWRPGEALVLVGPNGTGKTTLLHLILGLRAPTRGSLSIAGRDIARVDLVTLRRQTAFLPQRPYLGEPFSTVREAIAIACPGTTDDTARAALEGVHVRVSLDERIGELSAGQRQRIALARVSVLDAAMVLLDEPDANLDADGIALVSRLVDEWSAQGKMVAVVAHTKALAEREGVRVELASHPVG